MVLKLRKCPNCGAPVPLNEFHCAYCDSWFDESPPFPTPIKPTITPEQLLAADFGVKGKWLLWVCFIGAAILYGIGWMFEDLTYWLDTTAVVIWAGTQPVWIAFWSFLWRRRKGDWLPGFLFGITQFGIHMALIFCIDRHINDDGVGISAVFAGATLGGWLVGRIGHVWLQRVRSKYSLHKTSG